MKIAVLTTDTYHHRWYVDQLRKTVENLVCVVETKIHQPSFKCEHPFEKQRDVYECDYFFSGHPKLIHELCNTKTVDSINDTTTLDFLEKVKPEIIIVFGTGKIKADLLKKYSGRMINLHGGDPEYYRGLDSHLWSIYNNEWDALVTTLHLLNATLDDGDIIQKHQLDLNRIVDLHQLRTSNTEACLQLTLSALTTYQRSGYFVSSKQRSVGRYYSFMPAELKEICFKKFQKHVQKLSALNELHAESKVEAVV